MAAKIKYAQIGTNHGHASKIRTYQQSDDFEVVGICEPNEQLLAKAKASSAFRDIPFMTEQQLLNVGGLQVIGVETKPDDSLRASHLQSTPGCMSTSTNPRGLPYQDFDNSWMRPLENTSPFSLGTCTDTTQRSFCYVKCWQKGGSEMSSKSTQ